MGTLHFAIGALAMGVAGVFFDGTPLPMVAGITLCAVISFTLASSRSAARARRSKRRRISDRKYMKRGRVSPAFFMSADLSCPQIGLVEDEANTLLDGGERRGTSS